MARPKKVVSIETPIIEVKENQPLVSEVVVNKDENQKNTTLILCEVLIPFTEKKEFGGISHEKGSEISLDNVRLKNALEGRLVKIKK